jgi:choline dehydrogenase-like flavoprotein
MQVNSDAEARLAWWLDRVALLAVALALAALAAVLVAPAAFRAPLPAAGQAVAGLALLALLARCASGDVRRFRAMTWLVAAGLAVAGAALLLLWLVSGAAAGPAPLVGAALALALAGLVAQAERASGGRPPAYLPWATDKGPTRWEVVGSLIFGLAGALALAAAALLAAAAFGGPAPGLADSPARLLAYAGALSFWALLGGVLLVSSARIRRFDQMLALATASLGVGLVAQLAAAGALDPAASWGVGGAALSGRVAWNGALALFAAALLISLVLKNRMSHSVLDDLAYFAPLDFRAFEALAESLFVEGASDQVPPQQIALRVDDYLGSFRSRRVALARWCVRLWEFLPLIWLRPSLSLLAPSERRRFVEYHFVPEEEARRPLFRLLRALRLDVVIAGFETALRFAMQLAYMGYYGDPRVQRALGYVPFSERPKSFPVTPLRRHPPLRVETPQDLRVHGVEVIPSADVVVIGTGAGGAILAERLAARGREVLLLDKGPYVPPEAFTEDEIDMLSRLYGDGGLQMAESFKFNIVQGSCVGGTTVVNNAVCFATPDPVLDRWNDPAGADAGLDRARYRAAQAEVEASLKIRSIKESSRTREFPDVLNQGDRVIQRGVDCLLAGVPHEYDVVRANIDDCLGCGLCNFGCKYGRKLSMLDEVLPRAQHAYPKRFRVLSETEVVALRTQGGRVTEIVARVAGRRELTIRQPKTVVLSAGTIASSWLLLRSGIGRDLPVGRRLGANIATPLHGLFDEPLDSFHGLQIAHYLRLPDRPGFVLESEFNPPISQSLLMPGWLDTHERNMARYRQMSMFGVVVGSDPVGSVDPRGQPGTGAPQVRFDPTPRDLECLVEGMTLLGKVMFAAGAKEVLPSTRRYHPYDRPTARYRDPSELKHLEKLVTVDRDVVLATPHPQGGNPMSRRRGRPDGGVVDPEFRVYGYENLYVCDASVFPSPVMVNPQLSVMSLAHYAADAIR